MPKRKRAPDNTELELLAVAEQAAQDASTEAPGGWEVLADEPDMISRLDSDFDALGIVGERETALTIYLIGTSRLLTRPLAGVVCGESSAGKSFLVETVAELFPQEARYHATSMTPKALCHERAELAHRFVVAGERGHRNDEESAQANQALRQLLSEGKLTHRAAGRSDEGGHQTNELTVHGPIAYIETTTTDPDGIFTEDRNRRLCLSVTTTAEQTAHILAMQARRAAGLQG